MMRARTRVCLGLVAIFVALGSIYSLLIPVFEASDEIWHYPYVKHLADGYGLPVAQPGSFVDREATQPPLYYVVAALATFWIDTDNLPELTERNPHFPGYQVRPIRDNQNLVVHGAAEAFPWRRVALAIHISRIVAVLFGGLAVANVFFITCELFPEDFPLALGATSLAALNPQFIRTSGTASNDSAATALVALAVLLALRAGRTDLSYRQAAIIGGVSALAILSKLNAILVLPVVVAIVVVRQYQVMSFSGLLRRLFVLGLITMLLSGWWFARNLLLYQELTANTTHLQIAGWGKLSLTDVLDLWPETERTYWAAFGWAQLRVAPWMYTVLVRARYLAMIGLVIYLFRLFRRAGQRTDAFNLAFLVLWGGSALVMFLYWVSLVGSVSHGRLLYPALPAFSILLMLGWTQFVPRAGQFALASVVTVAMLMFAIVSLVKYILPAYTPPPVLVASDIPSDLPRLDYTYLDAMQLVAAQVLTTSTTVGGRATVVVYWQALRQMERNYSVYARLLTHDGEPIGKGVDTYPGLGLSPTRNWRPGDVLRDEYALSVPSEVDAPQLAQIVVGAYDYHSETRAGFPAINAFGNQAHPVVGYVKILPQSWPMAEPGSRLDVRFDDGPALVGFDHDCDFSVSACTLVLYWRPIAPPSADYTVFIQVWDATSQVAGFDGPPVGGGYPTTWWEAGEVIMDRHSLDLSGLPSGGYRLLIGLYRLETGERLAASGPDGNPLPDFAVEISLTP